MLFSEKGASGHSTKNFITRAGGARGVLRIQLSSEELHITTSLFFKPFAYLYDCYHIIKVDDITEVKEKGGWIYINFNKQGVSKQIAVKSRHHVELLEKLKMLIKK